MSTLYMVRHGENPANVTKQFAYQIVNFPLNEKGVLQAQQTAAYFSTLSQQRPIAAIYASPLLRTKQTAEIIADVLGLSITFLNDFREVNVGALERTPPTPESWAIYHEVVAAWRQGKSDVAFPEGESYRDMHKRVLNGLHTVLNQYPDHNVIIVGHGGVFTESVKDICANVDIMEIAQRGNHNCSITEIKARLQDGQLMGELVRWADYTHLYGEAAKLVSAIPALGEPIASAAPLTDHNNAE